MNWLQQFDTFSFLDNQQYTISPHSTECLAAAGIADSISSQDIKAVQLFINKHRGNWLFTHIGFEYFSSQNGLHDSIGFEKSFFYKPAVVLQLDEKSIHIIADNPGKVWKEIVDFSCVADNPGEVASETAVQIQSRLGKERYIKIIEQLQQHIVRGDCYEINYCQDFFAEDVTINPLSTYKRLSALSPNPFAAFYRHDNKWLLCASPERYLKKEGTRLLSQPIKGTSPRIPGNELLDRQMREGLYLSQKDRSENVMVVDLVRNDLSRLCKAGTVDVEELYGIYSFPQVHQMISTVSGELREGTSFMDIIGATFPMGSMTGAPKRKVIELIEQYELTRRGLFSGTIGYIDPQGDFDLNVIIRSILYNSTSGYLSLPAGSGITFYSDPEKEWEECLLKAEAMRKVLER